MVNVLKRIQIIICFGTLAFIGSSQIYAGGGMIVYDPINHATNALQVAHSAAQLIQQGSQIANQIQQIKYQVQNLGTVNDYQWQNLTGLVQQLDSVTQQGQAISYSGANIDQAFRQKYPDYLGQTSNGQTYAQAYQAWSGTTLDTINGSLDAQGLSAKNFQNEQSLLQQLRMQGRTAHGRMQVLQASSEISAENVNQLEELKRITLTQNNAQDAYMAYNVSKDSYQQKSLQQISNNVPTTFPTYQNNSKFSKIPDMSGGH